MATRPEVSGSARCVEGYDHYLYVVPAGLTAATLGHCWSLCALLCRCTCRAVLLPPKLHTGCERERALSTITPPQLPALVT